MSTPILDCTAGLPSVATLRDLVPWDGGRGYYAGRRVVLARTLLGDVIAEVWGVVQDNVGETVSIVPPLHTYAGYPQRRATAELAAAIAETGAPVLVEHVVPMGRLAERRWSELVTGARVAEVC